jgi:filamentous hemagglutinin family protein
MKTVYSLLASTLLWAVPVSAAQAQSIVPAQDGTGTIVTPQGNQFDIQGGKLSSDGKNLFHSFTQFGVGQNQIANFLSQPSIQNILGRVTGGEASIINGLLQVSGGNSNLVLMNPAGMVFGQGASLNVPASFTAVTANRIGLDHDRWFDSTNHNDFATLNGIPNRFEFATSIPGSIVNAANLSVAQGNLTLLGGTILSTGQLSAPNGEITIATVPGQSLVRLTQANSLLSFELSPLTPGSDAIAAPSIAQLLTGGSVSNATQIQTNSDGTLQLTGSGIQINSGDVFATQITSKTATLSATNDLKLVESQLQTSGNLNLFANNSVFIRDSVANPFLAKSGGDLYIQGNNGIDILALNHLDRKALISGGKLSLVSDGIISGDAHFASGGGFSVLSLTGKGGQFVSLYDPIVSVDGDVLFSGGYGGASLKVEAMGNIHFGTSGINITSRDLALDTFCQSNACSADAQILASQPAVILRAGVLVLIESSFGSPAYTIGGRSPEGSIQVDAPIRTTDPGGNLRVILDAKGNIHTDAILTEGGALTLKSGGIITSTGTFNTRSSARPGGAIDISAPGRIVLKQVVYGAPSGGIPSGNLTISTPDLLQLDPVGLPIPADPANAIDAGGANTSINARNLRIDSGRIQTLGGNLNITANDFLMNGTEVTTGGGNFDLRLTNPADYNWFSFLNTQGGHANITVPQLLRVTNSIWTGGGDLTLTGARIDAAGTTLRTEGLAGGRATFNSSSDVTLGTLFFGSTQIGGFGAPLEINAPGNVTINGSLSSINAPVLIGQSTAPNQVSVNGIISLRGGKVDIRSQGIISTQDIATNGGKVFLTSQGNLIANRPIVTQGGAISLTSQAGEVIATDLVTSGGRSNSGNVTVIARDRIKTGIINTSSTALDGGDVFLDPIGDIEVRSINAEGGSSGMGGNIDITAGRFFRALDTFVAQDGTNASLSTIGGRGSGSITIRHGGGLLNQPFEVGQSGAINGTAGAITTGTDNQILTGSFPHLYTQGTLPNEIRLETTPAPQSDGSPDFDQLDPDIEEVIADSDSDSELDMDLESGDASTFDAEVDVIDDMDAEFADEFQDHLGISKNTKEATVEQAQSIAADIERETGARPAFVYANFIPKTVASGSPKTVLRSLKQDSDVLELTVITAKGQPIRKVIYPATREVMLARAQRFLASVTDRTDEEYLQPAQELYQALITPIEADLKAKGINNLVFLMEGGLRSLPLAALHDGKQFLIENYSVGLMPSLSLTDTRYASVKNAKLLAMGASKFNQKDPLPAVPVELATITKKWGQGRSLLNEQFTIENLLTQRQQQPYGILHLATHGEFQPGAASESYIQFWDRKLKLNEMSTLRLNQPPVELMVMSACRTAIGDEQAELGFAGLAAQSGVKSALASLWYVSDEGTLALMSEFYRQLGTSSVKIKAEALRQAQVAMARGQVLLDRGQLKTPGLPSGVPLASAFAVLEQTELSHPYYWAAFTLIGNPW